MVAAAVALRLPCHRLPEGSGSYLGRRRRLATVKPDDSCSPSIGVNSGAPVSRGYRPLAVPIRAVGARQSSFAAARRMGDRTGVTGRDLKKVVIEDNPPCGDCSSHADPGDDPHHRQVSTGRKSTNIVWHECPVGKTERQNLLGQKGCLIWITGLSGSGKSTLACSLSRELHRRGNLTYVLDGDNVRYGLNRDLSFKPEDRAENIRRIGEVGKLFVDAGIICIASLISPYRRDRDACRALLPKGDFIEVFVDMPLELCEARDSKGLYKLARAGKITGFTGIDDPYEAPLCCEIIIGQKDGVCPSPTAMAEKVVSYLEQNSYLHV